MNLALLCQKYVFPGGTGGLPVDNAGGSSDILLRCVLKALDF